MDLSRRINANEELVVCFDVSKKKLDGYAIHVRQGAHDRELTVTIEREADQIEEQLSKLDSQLGILTHVTNNGSILVSLDWGYYSWEHLVLNDPSLCTREDVRP